MSSSLKWLLGITVLVIVGAIIYIVVDYETAEGIERTVIVTVAPSFEANNNPYLAGQELLDKYDVPSEVVTTIPYELKKNDTLMLFSKERTLGKMTAKRILDWVAEGGHLVITPAAYDEDNAVSLYERQEDHILNMLNVHVQNYTISPMDLSVELSSVSKRMEIDFQYTDRSFRAISAYEKGEPNPNLKQAEFYPLQYNGPEDKVITVSGDEAFYIELRHGEGRVTVIADSRFLQNDQIDDRDHSLIFWHLTTRNRQEGVGHVYISRRDGMPSIWNWLWDKASLLIITFVVGLAVWMWGASRRFGPIMKKEAGERRRLLEHIEASGAYYWRSKQTKYLLESSRSALLRLIFMRRPAWNHLNKTDLYNNMAELGGISYEEVRDAMMASVLKEGALMKKYIEDIEKIRRQL